VKRLRAVFWALAVLALVLAVGLSVRRSVAGAVRVAGSSMRPTLQDGDVALVTRFDYAVGNTPRRGDVVECRFPGRGDTYVKRVIGLPGEEIGFFGGALTVNGQVVREDYVSSPTGDYAVSLGEDEYLVLGDNRAESYDSRMADMGPLGADAFIGRVRCVIWPPGRIGPVR
jgi:signal peptidase I